MGTVKKVEVVHNSQTLFTQLSEDKMWYVRREVAQNLSTPPEVLTRLAEDGKWEVRYKVTFNPKILLQTLLKLTSDIKKRHTQKCLASPHLPSPPCRTRRNM